MTNREVIHVLGVELQIWRGQERVILKSIRHFDIETPSCGHSRSDARQKLFDVAHVLKNV